MCSRLGRLWYTGVGRKRIRRLMRVMGLSAIYQRPRTNVPHPEHPVFPYLLRGMEIIRANQVWCADITYIPCEADFCTLWRLWTGPAVKFCHGNSPTLWSLTSALPHLKRPLPGMGYQKSAIRIRVASLQASASCRFFKRTESRYMDGKGCRRGTTSWSSVFGAA
jgi:Transposase and inactivated derivatives